MDLTRIKNRLLARAFTAFPSLAARWAKELDRDSDLIPWVEPKKALAKACVALITTGGVHLRNDIPFDMQDKEGDPSYREVPLAADRASLTITHDYYNHADADQDLNLILPVDRLLTLEREGAVGRIHPVAYSFMGHIDGPHVETLRRKSAPEVARALLGAAVDYALLVPA